MSRVIILIEFIIIFIFTNILTGNTIKYHTVIKTENVYKIAKKYKTTPKQIKMLNKLKNYKIEIGQRLIVAMDSKAAYVTDNEQTYFNNMLKADSQKQAEFDTAIKLNNDTITYTSIKKPYIPIMEEVKKEENDGGMWNWFLNWITNSTYFVLFLLLGLTYFFSSTIVLLILISIFRKNYIIHKKLDEQLKSKYGDVLTNYVFNEIYQLDYTKLKADFKNKPNRDVFMNLLLDLHSNLTGDSAARLKRLYLELKFDLYSYLKIKNYYWHKKAKGFRELAQMDIKHAIPHIKKYLNHKNILLKIEAELAIMKLEDNKPLEFLENLLPEMSDWTQINMLSVLKYHKVDISEFNGWMSSKNKSVVIFAIRLITEYKNMQYYDSLIKLLEHRNAEVRKEVIIAMNNFVAMYFQNKLKEIFETEPDINKLAILSLLAKQNDVSNLDFFSEIICSKNNYTIRVFAIKAMKDMGTIGNSRLDTLYAVADKDIKYFINQAVIKNK